MKEKLQMIKEKKLIKRILILCFAQLLSALVFNLFQKKANLVTGGAGGIALILNHIFGFNTSDVITIVMLSFLVVSFIFLGWEATSGAVVSSIVYPLFIDLTEHLIEFINIDTSDMLLISIFVGLVSGISNGLIFKNGFNNGGTSVISQILYRYKKISISTASFIINLIVVVLGGFFFGWHMVMYAAITLYINSIVLDKILIGVSKNKFVYIVIDKEKEKEIKDYVIYTLKRGITEFEADGISKKKKVLMTVIPNSDYFKLKEGIKFVDKHTFFIVTDSYEVMGGE